MWIRASLILLGAAMASASELPDCPGSPNCVSSQASDPDKRVPALPGGEDAASALERLQGLLEELPRVSWETGPQGRQVHAVFASRLFRFKDDVDFLIRDDGRIEVRSASRLGYWDLGANRRRVEKLRQALRKKTENN